VRFYRLLPLGLVLLAGCTIDVSATPPPETATTTAPPVSAETTTSTTLGDEVPATTRADVRDVTDDSATPTEPGVFVGSLEAGGVKQGNTWFAEVVVVVLDDGDRPVADVSVTVHWDDADEDQEACLTDSAGRCPFVSDAVANRVKSVTLSVDDLSHDALPYLPDQDADRVDDTTSVTVRKP
jgi:hypothetical protein